METIGVSYQKKKMKFIPIEWQCPNVWCYAEAARWLSIYFFENILWNVDTTDFASIHIKANWFWTRRKCDFSVYSFKFFETPTEYGSIGFAIPDVIQKWSISYEPCGFILIRIEMAQFE